MSDKGVFKIEAIVSCDDRGQLILPKDIRKRLSINAGDKMALINCSTDQTFCLTLVKANSLENLLKTYLTPVLSEISK